MLRRAISLCRPFFERFPRLAALYRNIRDRLDFWQGPVETVWGFKLAGNRLMAEGLFEPVETEVIRNLLKDADILVNAGANIGYYCCQALSMGKSVIAFEPIRRNLNYLYKNIRINGWDKAEIYPAALSDRQGVLEIYGGNTGASVVKGWAGIPQSYVRLVPALTMDSVLGRRLEGKKVLVLIDVEGAEKMVLAGASQLLANLPAPVWMVEIMAKDHQPHGLSMNPDFNKVFEIFFQNGYQAFSADRHLSPVTKEDVDRIVKGTLSAPAHNFLFTKRKENI
jgi:FkbM family methyltransferase